MSNLPRSTGFVGDESKNWFAVGLSVPASCLIASSSLAIELRILCAPCFPAWLSSCFGSGSFCSGSGFAVGSVCFVGSCFVGSGSVGLERSSSGSVAFFSDGPSIAEVSFFSDGPGIGGLCWSGVFSEEVMGEEEGEEGAGEVAGEGAGEVVGEGAGDVGEEVVLGATEEDSREEGVETVGEGEEEGEGE